MEDFGMHTVPDETLVSRIRQDDGQALEALFYRYYKSLCQFCSVYTKSYEAAEEIIADLFIRVWDNRQTAEIGHVKAYLFTSARNQSINYVQKKKLPVQSLEDLTDHQQLFKDMDTPFRIISGRESSAEILRLIDGLPARQREVLLMSRIDNIDKSEIARMLNISLRTVETTLYQAIRELRSMLRRSTNLSSGA
jgi:RNA polymerase sigma-70 factor (ECF subfamily)